MWKPSLILVKIVNQKQYVISRGITEINATMEDLKDARIVAPITSLLNSHFEPLQKPDTS